MSALFFLLFGFCFFSDANDSLGQWQLLARSHFIHSYRLSPQTYLTNSTPQINNKSQVAIRLVGVEGTSQAGIWLGDRDSSHIIYLGPEGRLLSDVSLAENGHLYFSQFDFGLLDGIFEYQSADGRIRLRLAPNDFVRPESFDFPQAFGEGEELLFRLMDKNGDRHFVKKNKGEEYQILKQEGDGLSFLFRPDTAGDYIVSKVRLGESYDFGEDRPDQIRLYNGKEWKVIAQDRDADENSTYLSFDNSPVVSELGGVVFIAAVYPSGRRAIFLKEKNKAAVQMAKEGVELEKIDFFRPAINSSHQVIFRGVDLEGRHSLFRYRAKQGLERVLGQGDVLASDLGPARVYSRPGQMAFSGAPDINDLGEIVVNLILENKEETYLGQAIYIKRP